MRGLREEIDKIVGDLALAQREADHRPLRRHQAHRYRQPLDPGEQSEAPYWETAPSHDGNKHYRLANLVRASTAAPHFFDPELIPINSRKAQLPLETSAPLDKPMPRAVSDAGPSCERLRIARQSAVPDTTETMGCSSTAA